MEDDDLDGPARTRHRSHTLDEWDIVEAIPENDPQELAERLLVPGEAVVARVRATCVYAATAFDTDQGVVGALVLTSFRLLFFDDDDAAAPCVQVFVHGVERLERSVRARGDFVLVLHGRDCRRVAFVLAARDGGFEHVLRQTVAPSSSEALFAFRHGGAGGTPPDPKGWDLFTPAREFARQGALGSASSRWRLSAANEKYELCPSYPSHLLVPAGLSDAAISGSAEFRSKRRVPVVTWAAGPAGPALVRASQPKPGLLRARNRFDEDLMRAYGTGKAGLTVFDCRGRMSAVANHARGGGCETGPNIQFLSVPNIHEMRRSFQALRSICTQPDHGPSALSQLDSTQWLTYVALLLDSASRVARTVHCKGRSALVHCSDGWDRTAQVAALAQLLMDPYYRTVEGLCVLIEKDFCSFGHGFARRTGFPGSTRDKIGGTTIASAVASPAVSPPQSPGPHASPVPPLASLTSRVFEKLGSGGANSPRSSMELDLGTATAGISSPEDRSPIFVQFLDCVFQLISQFPCAFEYGPDALLRISDALLNCRYGTFLFDCERERVEEQLRERTHALWGTICDDASLRNPFFKPDANRILLEPATAVRAMDLWRPLYLRFSQAQADKNGLWCRVHRHTEDTKSLQERGREMQTELEQLRKEVVRLRQLAGDVESVKVEETGPVLFTCSSRIRADTFDSTDYLLEEYDSPLLEKRADERPLLESSSPESGEG